MNNIVKHSKASEIAVHLLLSPDSVELNISDNGSGFDFEIVTATQLGLRIMRERAEAIGAYLEIASKQSSGPESQ